MKEGEVERACGTHGKDRNMYWVWLGNLKERDHLKDMGINGRIILKLIIQK